MPDQPPLSCPPPQKQNLEEKEADSSEEMEDPTQTIETDRLMQNFENEPGFNRNGSKVRLSDLGLLNLKEQ